MSYDAGVDHSSFKYIQTGRRKFRWMKGGKGAIIDSYAWAQTVRRGFNLPLQL